jgi:hypothetical protein
MTASFRTQPPPKPALWFVAHTVALTLLIGFWPTPRAVYPALFHAHANALFGSLAAPHVRLAAGQVTDTAMTVAARAGATDAVVSSFSIGRIGYWPSALLVAMLIATPLSALRRAAAVAIGLALVDLFTLARVGIEVAHLDSLLAHGGAPAPGAGPLLLRVGSESLTATIPSAAFVLVCWVALARPWRTIDLGSARAWLIPRSTP